MRARAWGRPLLLVGRRWDLDIVEPLDFSQPGWGEVLSAMALTRGKQRTPEWIDYFAFPRGLCEEMPPFAVGRPGWDNWMIWKFRRSGVSVLDVSPSVVAIHQNHTSQSSHRHRRDRGRPRNLRATALWQETGAVITLSPTPQKC